MFEEMSQCSTLSQFAQNSQGFEFANMQKSYCETLIVFN